MTDCNSPPLSSSSPVPGDVQAPSAGQVRSGKRRGTGAGLERAVGPRAVGPGSGVELEFGGAAAAAEGAGPVVAPAACGAPPGTFWQIPWAPHHLCPFTQNQNLKTHSLLSW